MNLKNVDIRHLLWVAILLLLIIDQTIKIEVKTNMCLYEHISVTDWFYISFVENNGMAFGMAFLNKVVLSLFRIVASSIIGYYLYRQIKNKESRLGYLICISLILAGAIGNIIDCMFYGLCFTESTPYTVSTSVPLGDGYAPFLMGRVVDMFYFPIIETYLPEWMPFVGGNHFVFFSPVFNFADACVSVGFILLLLFYRKELSTLSFSLKHNDTEVKEKYDKKV
ncbi:MAG: lipoprotein signal peptidase [Prevotella sp.]|nr:lipoprotein signal peptidase [Prevotella sp.]MBQ9670502.1 lipoprotein signal peptidase [Prevotella sp.]